MLGLPVSLGDVLAARNSQGPPIVGAARPRGGPPAGCSDNIERLSAAIPAACMIFGQSGGGAKVSTLLAMPSAKGLFHRAVIESGTALRGGEREDANKRAHALLKQLGISPGQARDLQKVPLDKLLAVSSKVTGDGVPPAFAPWSTARFCRHIPSTRSPPRCRQTSRSSSDTREPSGPSISSTTRRRPSWMKPGCSTTRKERAWRFGRQCDRKLPEEVSQGEPRRSVRLHSDGRRRHQDSIRLAERQGPRFGKAPTYLYVFAWETPVMGLRSPHQIEIPFVFDHIDVSQSMVGPVSPPMRELEAATAGAWAASPTRGTPITSGSALARVHARHASDDDLRHALPRGERSDGRSPANPGKTRDHSTRTLISNAHHGLH